MSHIDGVCSFAATLLIATVAMACTVNGKQYGPGSTSSVAEPPAQPAPVAAPSAASPDEPTDGADASAPRTAEPTASSTRGERAAFDAHFREVVSDSLRLAKEKCGAGFTVSTDFENFDRRAWIAAMKEAEASQGGGKSRRPGGREPPRESLDDLEVAYQCSKALRGLADHCSSPSRRGEPVPEVKRLDCLFAGHQPRKPGESDDSYIERNLTFANGVLTFRMDPRLGADAGYNATSVIRGLDKYVDLAVGASCTEHKQCLTNLCTAGKCRGCSRKYTCWDSAQTCFPSGGCFLQEKSSPAPKERRGIGRFCDADADCEEGRSCKLSGAMGRRNQRTCQ